jgi:LysM repeat protein
MTSNEHDGNSKNQRIRAEVIIGLASLIVAILAWLFPFSPMGCTLTHSCSNTPQYTQIATSISIVSKLNTLTEEANLASTFTPLPTNIPKPTAEIVSSVIVPTMSGRGGLPATYTLQEGEFPQCIARRYNLNPEELLRLNNLRDWNAQYLSPGLTLQLPQTGDPFPGIRALHNHPDTYTVSGNNDTTIYGIACHYGDVDPAAITQANNLPLYTNLTIGQQLTIP